MVDADSDATADPLFSIEEGAAYFLPNLRDAFPGVTNFAVACITDPAPFATTPFAIGSVGLRDNNFQTHVGRNGDNSGKDFNAENNAPYALADYDETTGSFTPVDFSVGEDWSITCQAFCQANLLGDESDAVTRTFTVIP